MAAHTSETVKFLQSVSSDQTWWKSRYIIQETAFLFWNLSMYSCGKEITSNSSDPFPPQNHHQHSQQQAIKWQLIVRTDTKVTVSDQMIENPPGLFYT